MNKFFIIKLPYFLMVIFTFYYSNYLYSQEISTYSSDELLSIGIDPNNYQQIIDSLISNSLRTRSIIIEYCGEKKIYDSIDELEMLLVNTLFPENPSYQYSYTERAKILFSLVELEDSTIQEELRDAILIMSEDSLNIFYLSFFSRYLMLKFNDDFGWQYIKPYYVRGSSLTFSVNVNHIKEFLNSSASEEVISVLRNLALTDYLADNRITAIDYLTDINDEEVIDIITQASTSDPYKMNRYLARENLKKINYDIYIDVLKSALETETDYRLFIYDGLLRTGQPSVYKYVVDLYNSNQYPSDSSTIYNEFDNPWLLNPQQYESVLSLLDSLSSSLFQFNSFGWLGNINFVNELNNYVMNSKLYYLSNDTINSANELKMMREMIDHESRDTTDVVNSFINPDAWKYLFSRTYFIERRINREWYSDTLISITPSSVVAGSPTITAHIIGSGFSNGTYVFWNENYYLDYSIISPNEIQATIPDSFLTEQGEYKIDVSNFFSTISNSLTLNVVSSGESISTYTIFATHGVWLEQNSEVISGNVGVNEIGQPPFMDSGVELSVGISTETPAGYTIKANRIKVKQGATVNSDVYYNELDNNGTITGTLNTPLELPLFTALPEFHTSTPGTQNITVPQNGVQILQPGSYNNIEVKRYGKLIFTGGEYHINKLTAGDDNQLLFQSESEVRIKDKFDSGQGTYIGAEDTIRQLPDADEIVFYVGGINGTNGNLGATPKAAKIGISNLVKANFYVPNGTLWIRQNSEVEGSFIGKDVDVGIGVKVKLNSAF